MSPPKGIVAVGAVVTVVKPERFVRRLFQTACGNHQEEVAEGHLCRFPQLWPFPQRVRRAFVLRVWF